MGESAWEDLRLGKLEGPEIGDEGTGAGQPTSAPGEAGDLPEGAGLEAAWQTDGTDEPRG